MKQKITLLTRMMLLLCALIVGSGSVWAENKITFDLSTGYTNAQQVAEVSSGGVTITFAKGTGSNAPAWYNSGTALRFYSGNTITFASSGAKIEKVVLTNTESQLVGGTDGANFPTDGTYSVSNKVETWTPNTPLESFTINITNKPRLTKIEVFLEEDASLEDCDLALTGAPVELEFDLYNNADAQVVSYTTSSTGAITIEPATSEYFTYTHDAEAKTITVTPVAVTPSAQTVTISQAADDTYKAGSTSFTITIADTTPFNGVIFDATTDKGTSPIVKDNVSFACTSGVLDNGSEYRLYKNSTTTINTTDGSKITKIEFVGVQGYAASNFTTQTGWTATGNDGVWEGEAESVSFIASGAQVRATEIKVTVEQNTNPSISANNVEIAYDATSGEIAYSIVNPIDGTTLTAASEAEWISDITVAEDKVTFTTTANEGAERTATITLTYGTLTKDVTVTQAAAPVIYTTIPDLFAAATSTATDVNVTFNNWVVSGVSTNGKNVFVTDGTNGFVIFDSNGGLNNTYAVGNILSGTAVSCKLQLFNGFVEITELDATDLTITAGGTISAANITMADLTGVNTGALVSYTNLTCTITSGKYYLSDGTTTLQVYNALYAFGALEAGKTYNITGIYQQYNTTKEILPRSADDIEEVVILVPSITLSTNTIEASAEGADGTITVTYENLTEVVAEIHFYDAEGAEATYDWIDAEINDENNLYYIISDNTGDARTAYMKVYALDDEGQDVYSELITITQAAPVVTTTYTLATAIVPGKHYIIVGGNKAMGGQNNNNRAAVDVTIDEEVASVSSDQEVCEFIIYGPDANGRYSIYDETVPGYLYAASKSSNHLKTQASNNINGKWSITFSDGVASIVADGSSNRNVMRYNSSNSVFSCYAEENNQADVYLYEKDGEATPTANVTLAASGYATYCSPLALDLTPTEDYAAWIVTGVNGTTVNFTKITGAVPAETPFILYGQNYGGQTATLTVATGEVTPISGNMLKGTLEPTQVTTEMEINGQSYTLYGLSNGEFQKINAGTIPANKAYLPILTSEAPASGARLRIVFGGEATGIAENVIMRNVDNENVYNLNGQRVSQPKKGGLYIVNGKKTLVK